jgi:putative membrane protein
MKKRDIVLYAIAGVMLLFKVVTMIFNIDISFMEPAGMLVIFIVLTIPLVTLWKAFAVIAIGTLLIEIIGVYTGFPFGAYVYGNEATYLSILDVPLFIPLAWYILIAGFSRIIGSWWGTAILIVVTDIMLEEFAVIKGYWGWEPHPFFLEAPLQNYISWGVIAVIGFFLLRGAKLPFLSSLVSLVMIIGYLTLFLFMEGSGYAWVGLLLIVFVFIQMFFWKKRSEKRKNEELRVGN